MLPGQGISFARIGKIVFVTLISFLAVGFTANGSWGQSGKRPVDPIDEAVESLAADRSISLAEAQQRLAWQQRTPELEEELRSTLGDNFGGVWIAPEDGDRVKVGVVGKMKVRTANVQNAIERLGLAGAADVVTVRYSLAHLESIIGWLAPKLEEANVGADWPLSSGLRTDFNTVELRLPSRGELTPAQKAVVARAKARYGKALRLDTYDYIPQAHVCTYPYCDPPLRAGIHIFNPLNSDPQRQSNCTGGFTARSRSDNLWYQFTAGHCAVEGDTWYTQFPDTSTHVIGAVHNSIFSGTGDMAILRVDNPSGWNPRGWVFITAGPDTTLDENYPIMSTEYSTIGQRICKTGAYFGRTSCGTVRALDVTITYNGQTVGNLGRADYCGVPGDSGAPVFANNVAYGIHVAGVEEDPCKETYYQGIRGSEDAMNVNVERESVPVITAITFPPSIRGDRVPVPGTVTFTDSNAGVNWAQFDVAQDTCGGCFQPFGFDPGVGNLTNGQFEFNMWCEGDFSWTMKVTLKDVENHVSNPYNFSVKCVPVSARTSGMSRGSLTEGGGGD